MVGCDPDDSVSHELWDPMRACGGMLRRKGSGSGSSLPTMVGVDRYGDGKGGTGGIGDSRSVNGVAGVNQKEDFGGMDGYEPVTGFCRTEPWWEILCE